MTRAAGARERDEQKTSSEEDQRRLWASGNTHYAVMSGFENRGIKHQSCQF